MAHQQNKGYQSDVFISEDVALVSILCSYALGREKVINNLLATDYFIEINAYICNVKQ